MLKEIFSKKLNIPSRTVNNAIITLGDTDDSGKGRHFKSRFIQPGVAGYPGQFGNVLITKESLDKFINTMVGVPVIVNHTNLNKDNADDLRVGVVNSVWYDDKDGWYWCDGIIWDETAQNLITDKNWSVSCSYDVKTADNKGGSENNIKYDMEFLDGVFTHLALVNNPRYERANIVFNSKTAYVTSSLDDFTEIFYEALTEVVAENCLKADNERWITIKPHGDDSDDYRRLKLEDGETPKEAIERVYKKEDKKHENKESETKILDAEDKSQISKQQDMFYKRHLSKEQLDILNKKLSKLKKNVYELRTVIWGYKPNKHNYTEADLIEAENKYNDFKNKYAEQVKEYNILYRSAAKIQREAIEHFKKDINIKEALNKNKYSKLYTDIQKEHKQYTDLKLENEKILQVAYDYYNKMAEYKKQGENELAQKYYNSYREKFAEYNKKQAELPRHLQNKYKKISEILQTTNSADIEINLPAKSVLSEDINNAKTLLNGIIDKDSLPQFAPNAKGTTAVRDNCRGNFLNLNKNKDVTVVLHEYMHWLEDVNPKIMANSMAFLEYRTVGEEEQYLKTLTDNKDYHNEKAKPDKFFSPYCGKIYEDATEIMSMGLQQIFEDVNKIDTEYFNFVIANLRNKI